MKKNAGFLIALALLAVVGGAVGYLMFQDSKAPGEQPPPETRIFKDDLKGLTRLVLSRPGEEPVTLAPIPAKSAGSSTSKKDAGATGEEAFEPWRIETPAPYRADAMVVGELLGTLRTLEAERVMDAPAGGPSDSASAAFGLESPMLSLEIQEGNTQRTLEIGSVNPTGSARYARLSGSPKLYLLAVGSVTKLNKPLADLRQKRVFDLSEFTVEGLQLETPAGIKKIIRGPRQRWTFSSPEGFRADQTMMGEFVSTITGARADAAALSHPSLDESRFRSMPLVAEVTLSMPGQHEKAEFRRDKDNTIFAKSDDLSGIYPVQTEIDTYLKKPVPDFRELRIFEFGFSDVFTLHFEGGGRSFTLRKPNADWQLDGKTIDSAKANKLLDELRSIVATAYLEGEAPGSVSHKVEVETSDSSKETVELRTSGSDSFAVRVGEKGYYKLPENVLKELDTAAAEIQPSAKKP